VNDEALTQVGGCCAKNKEIKQKILYLITHKSISLFHPVRNFDVTASDFDFRAFFPNMLATYLIGFMIILYLCQFRGHELSQLVEALRCTSEVRGFDSR
jgi:hypothetical protein